MAKFVTLDHFQATHRHYHIYSIRKTELDHLDHYHNFYQVCYVVSGEIFHRQGNNVVTLSAGDAFIVPPGFTHSLHFNNSYTEMYSLSFVETLFAPGFPQSNAYQFLANLQTKVAFSNQNSVRLRVTLNRNQRKLIEKLLESLVLQQQIDCPLGLTAASSLTAAIIYVLAQAYYLQPQNSPEIDELEHYNTTLLQCVAYIDENFRKPLSLTTLSRKFGLSRSSFCSVFPKFTGMPLRKYIAHKRIKEAQALIRSNPEKSLSLIAAEVGYRDNSTFYRNFAQITGLAPSKYKAVFFSNEDSNIIDE